MEKKPENKLEPHEEYSDGKYTILSFKKSDDSFRRITCSEESICLIPFCLNEHDQIKYIYLSKYRDYLRNGDNFTCIAGKVDKKQSDSYYEVVEDLISREIEVADVEVNDIYFLGNVDHTVPFTKGFRCYAVNLTKYLDMPYQDSLGDGRLKARDKINKVRFSKVFNGEITDSLVLSASLLLISYFQK